MINRSPWLWNANQTAAGMTARTSNGIRILQGKRAPGQSNPSQEYIDSQLAAALIWPYFQKAPGFIRENWLNPAEGTYPANEFFRWAYLNCINFAVPGAPIINPVGLRWASGTMTQTLVTAVTADESLATVIVTWDPPPADGSQLATDDAFVVLLNQANGRLIAGNAIADRSTGTTGSIAAGSLLMAAGETVIAYLSFRGGTGTANEGTGSDNTVMTTVVVA